ncbi:MAG: DNA translocase FtsK 4TM domain-containing protein, partial [Verrucomicrobiales bacterium]|nr:DNA translocase FtsK 4TM domain-containing protein [Verrucomicrobiales bacterium]
MAKTSNTTSEAHRGRLDLVGAILVAVALVWLVALFSYDRLDLRVNTARPNDPAHNWIGPVGAWWSELTFFGFGAAAFAIPLGLLVFGLGCLAEIFGFARRRWIWLVVLGLVSTVLFALNPGLVGRFAGTELPGGWVGNFLNPSRFFGYAGSMAGCILLYLLGLLGLSDFQLFDWIRLWWAERRARAEARLDEEVRLDRKARALEKEARRLQELVDRERDTALPAPTLAEAATPTKPGPSPTPAPGPEPVVRDLSVPQPKPASPSPASRKGAPPAPPAVLEGEVITAREIAAAGGSPAAGKSHTPSGPHSDPAPGSPAAGAHPTPQANDEPASPLKPG